MFTDHILCLIIWWDSLEVVAKGDQIQWTVTLSKITEFQVWFEHGISTMHKKDLVIFGHFTADMYLNFTCA